MGTEFCWGIEVSIKIGTMKVERRWGRGFLTRRLVRTWCSLTGHRWRRWHYDWPYDLPEVWEESGICGDPKPDEELVWMRTCARDCGVIETARASLLQRAALPGETTCVEDNPIRRAV
jgi:hypothetical protein